MPSTGESSFSSCIFESVVFVDMRRAIAGGGHDSCPAVAVVVSDEEDDGIPTTGCLFVDISYRTVRGIATRRR